MLGIGKFLINTTLAESVSVADNFMANSLTEFDAYFPLSSYPHVGHFATKDSKTSPQFGHL